MGSASRPAWSGLLGLALVLSLRAFSGETKGTQGLPVSCLALEMGLAQSFQINRKASSSWVLWSARSPGARKERGLAGWAGPHGGAVSPEATSKAAPAIRVHFPQLRAFPVLSASPPAPPPRQLGLREPGPEVCSHFPQECA